VPRDVRWNFEARHGSGVRALLGTRQGAVAAAPSAAARSEVWRYGSVALVVARFSELLAPRLIRGLEQLSGAVPGGFGIRLATEAR